MKKLLLKFFEKHNNYPGWKNIAEKLIETGECIVAGNDCIWHSGIGNFIKTETAENFVDCLLYKFDLEYFKTSEWYKEIKLLHIQELKQEIDNYNTIIYKLNTELKELS